MDNSPQNNVGRSSNEKAVYANIGTNENLAKSKLNRIETPSISLPKGGGAIKSIDEKFEVNSSNGTGSLSFSFPASPARGFEPQLGLSYNSGAGNSPFGLGWGMGALMIQRRTEKKLPLYNDEDIFVFSGAEDLVPCLEKIEGKWEEKKKVVGDRTLTWFRPRIEGGFARIIFIQKTDGTNYWEVTDRNNVVSVFGKSDQCQLSDPKDTKKVFRWHLEYSYDDKGNFIQYRYKKEDDQQVGKRIWENNRVYTNIYLKRVSYGNVTPFCREAPDQIPNEFMFDIVLDYGEHEQERPTIDEVSGWKSRLDSFSDFRAGFEIRTHRLCRRVLMFHHFQELGLEDYLVRSWNLDYNEKPHLAYLAQIRQDSFIWNDDGTVRTLHEASPISFTYWELDSNTYGRTVKEISPDSLANLPAGLDNQLYQFTDLYSEGVSGILTEQATGWFYKENLGDGQFGPVRSIAPKPAMAVANGWQLQDLEADGKKYLVSIDNALPGYFELSPVSEEWQPFRPFEAYPNIDFSDPNLIMLDLDGDGQADIMITEDAVVRWYPSKGKAGFGQRVSVPWDYEEDSPRILFSNPDEKLMIGIADMSGGGLGDIVRITNSEVCYFPNLGYGRFGKKIILGGLSAFDHPDLFNPAFLHFADIDGSGTTDLIYIGNQKIQVYFNQSGNSLSEVFEFFNPFPQIDNFSRISVLDLLGTGTASLVWSSALPGHSQSPLRYIDFMRSEKPHLMTGYQNNQGKKVSFTYKPSTFFYLQDKKEGKPWATKLPFPVHVLSKVVVEDSVSQTRFTNAYRYRHGFYDAQEREFRGFAYTEQTDTESFEDYSVFAEQSPVHAGEKEFYQAAVITKSWFHTGAWFNKGYGIAVAKILDNHPLATEYYQTGSLLSEAPLPSTMSLDEKEECYRALKGLPLRQEVYSDEGTDLEKAIPYTIAQMNYDVQMLQPQSENQYAVFFPINRETVTYQLERNPADPRVTQSINLEIDELGNVLKAASIVYGRKIADADLENRDQEKQAEKHIIVTENSFTNDDIDKPNYRLRLPWEVKAWELKLAAPDSVFFNPTALLDSFQNAAVAGYENTAQTNEKRLIEHTRSLFLANDLSGLLPLGELQSRALPGESYALAFTDSLLDMLYGNKVDSAILETGRHTKLDDQYWISSGRAWYQADLCENNDPDVSPAMDLAFARQNFFQPNLFVDSFGSATCLCYDKRNLFVKTITDGVGNQTVIEQFNYRLLAPTFVRDPNYNRSGVRADAAGRVTASFVMGKSNEAAGDFMVIDSLEADPSDRPSVAIQYYDKQYEINESPNYVYTRAFETYFYDDVANAESRKFLESFAYSDGSGNEVLTKAKAEGGLAPIRNAEGKLVLDVNGKPTQQNAPIRWIGNGRTILNNKGNPVKQYEPFFDSEPIYTREDELVAIGVTPLLFYDALGRNIRTHMPDGTLTRREFDAWKQAVYDQNDTVGEAECQWYLNRKDGQMGPVEQLAAQKAFKHANTPSTVYLDSLGRPFLSVAHNATPNPNDNSWVTELYKTQSEYDIEGNILSITDPRGNKVMAWKYDMLGYVCYQTSMDAGERWQLNDAMGKPLRAWDSRDHEFQYKYEIKRLHRPLETKLLKDNATYSIARIAYGEGLPNALENNLRGQVVEVYDESGKTETPQYDFKGNSLITRRQLAANATLEVQNWAVPGTTLMVDVFVQTTKVDALNRMVEIENFHREGYTQPPGIYKPVYNARGVLQSESLTVSGELIDAITGIAYDSKGQRTQIDYGNGTTTRHTYDPLTFRLTRLYTPGLQDLTYTYDPVGNITQMEDWAQEKVFFNNAQIDPLNEYTYDALYRLVEARGRENIGNQAPIAFDPPPMQVNFPISDQALRNYIQTYTYDAAGNILRMRHRAGTENMSERWTRHYQYSMRSNRLLATQVGGDSVYDHYVDEQVSGSVTLSDRYPYDSHGNMLNAAGNGYATRWDHRDMISHIDLGGGGDAFYHYDSSKQRTRKYIKRQNIGGYSERIYLGGYELYRRYGLANEIIEETETHHLFADDQRVLIVEDVLRSSSEGGGWEGVLQRYQYANHLGSATLECNENAAVISYEEYHPYGTTSYYARNQTIKATAKRYRYTGMERDEESGLAYHTARYYLPWLGRWASADPISVEGGVNLYAYCEGRPSNWVDYLGKQPSSAELSELFWRYNSEQVDYNTKSLWEFMVGGRAYPHFSTNTFDIKMPEGGPGGLIGGALRAASLRLTPKERNPSKKSESGSKFGAGLIPVLDPAARLVTGKDVVGDETSRGHAFVDLLIDVVPAAWELRGAKFTRGASGVEVSAKESRNHIVNVREQSAPILGNAQKTRTPGHAEVSEKIATEMSKQPDVKRVALNLGYRKATDGVINSRRIPDVTVTSLDGLVEVFEVASKTDIVSKLISRTLKVTKTTTVVTLTKKQNDQAIAIFKKFLSK
ncbi:SpvB/TcaC N-terminal domain-containing protein [Dyadobacter sp. CY347]|uniref:SpvB/TcaC N-terminal domain-containing protein n=1 Tax=Dyadobacter sp. CY347 TaxID=2909336 RepID=UPI001F43EEAD|nr:SpvB/TcaC N-terminal domain-containing protein [Dyadobacter sp. CY347]MCF2490256.1 insecticidal toxin complex protein [Dyadobacter sp. CY347]